MGHRIPLLTPLRLARLAASPPMSQQHLARLSGVSRTTLSFAECGGPLTRDAAVRLAAVLRVDPLTLLQPQEPPCI